MRNPLCLFGAALFALSLPAQAQPAVSDAPPPPIVSDAESGSEPLAGEEPEITVIKRENAEIHEYRRSGRLYMVKIIPSAGPAYYLVDADGDGTLESQRFDLTPPLLIPSWVLFSW